MHRPLHAWWLVGLLACRPGSDQPRGDAKAVGTEPAATDAKLEVLPSGPASPTPQPTREPPRATAPTTDELLVLDTIACHITGAQELVDCEPRWQALLRTPTAPRWAECVLADEAVVAHQPVANELWRGRFTIEKLDDFPPTSRCDVASIDARMAREEHQIQALTRSVLADVQTAVHVDPRDQEQRRVLEQGPVRAVMGSVSHRARFLATYLDELGPLLAIPGRELMTRATLAAVLDQQFAGEWRMFVQGAYTFDPEVPDPDLRRAWGRTPLFSACDVEGYNLYYCPFAIPVQAGGERRYLILAATTMRGPDFSALTRRLLIQRIVEDGLEPTPEAVARAR